MILQWSWQQVSASFKSSLADSICSALADLIRSMNCYYSNLIEGHNTHPVDIGALTSDSSRAPLQLAFPAKLAGRWMRGLFPDE